MILCTDERIYTGITTDIDRRWQEHSGHLKNGAKFFRGRKPKELIYVEFFEDRSGASKRESVIKKCSRESKLLLINSDENRLNERKFKFQIK